MSAKIKPGKFRVAEGQTVKLKRWPTAVRPFYESKEDYGEMLQKHVSKLSRLQAMLYAQDRYAVLLIFQAMDAAGKDGVIKHVMSGVNPQGCQVSSFKQPSLEELDHDFLWRTTRRLPERGRIGIFNRSYYEEVLIVRVHPEFLQKQNLPEQDGSDERLWKGRYQSIRDFESHLTRNGTRIIKFFLHLSRQEQRRRFLSRLDEPEKNWKVSMGDIQERKYWNDYMKAYQQCLSATSTDAAPWYIVPADDKANARLIVSEIIVDTLNSLSLAFPTPGKEQRRELRQVRAALRRDEDCDA